ncbi:MAG TPA: hypothetical protein DCL61_01800 [Cyanobacteria bacterium UBA12227]|nr:hypothetical protein [Cyanobacteria bacterium UBA12227]HAX88403.1 hypothetical protein [Cyanobacteria bacterium UBA11370]HBY75803.1 hypothetical protein [Cyanobacteria bacterium UBA11148]
MPHNINRNDFAPETYPIGYRKRLYPWAIAHLRPNMQKTIIGRFRSRSDADGHLRCLRQLMPHASFIVVFDIQPDLETVTISAASTEDVMI